MANVLVVDDSTVDRKLAGGLLQKGIQCQVTYASDGKEALTHFDDAVPDLVLADLQMPEMNGLELLTAIRQEHPLVPIVLMTAVGSEEIASEALRQGAASYVPKSRMALDLVPTVERILAVSREERGFSHLMHYLRESECSFVLRNDLRLIRAAVGYVQQMLRCLPLGSETERVRIGIALEAALENACYHGNLEMGTSVLREDSESFAALYQQRVRSEPYRDRHIHLKAKILPDSVTFVIQDEGPGFDPAQMAHVSTPEQLVQISGRGGVLMWSIMDEVRYNDVGNVVTLIKRVPELDHYEHGEPDVEEGEET